MADDIGQIVEVYISRETAQIDTASFDIPLLMVNLPDTVDNSGWPPANVPADTTNRVREYTSLTEVGEDFGITSTAYVMTQKLLGNDIRPARFMIGVKDSTETYTQGLQAILAYNNDWYAIAIDSKVEGDIKEVAAVIQAELKIFVSSTADVGVPNPATTTDIGSFLMMVIMTEQFWCITPLLLPNTLKSVGWVVRSQKSLEVIHGILNLQTVFKFLN